MAIDTPIHVYFNETEKRCDLKIGGVFVGPVDDALRFIYGAKVEIERDRLFPTPGLSVGAGGK